jgi:hypothetical protein
VTRYRGTVCPVNLGVLTAILAIVILVGGAEGADKVRIGVSNYNLSNLTVGVAQTKDFFRHITRQVALNEVSDTNPLREEQRELGVPHFLPPHRGGG